MAAEARHRWSEIPIQNHVILLHGGSRDIHVLDPVAHWAWSARQSGLTAEDVKELLAQSEAPVCLTANQVDQWFERWEKTEAEAGERVADRQKSQPKPPAVPPPRLSISTAYGFSELSIGVDYGDNELHDRGQQILGHLSVRDTKRSQTHLVSLYRDGGRIAVHGRHRVAWAETLDDAMSHLVFMVVETLIEAGSRLVTLHAAAVEQRGIGIILLGAGGSGKSTLAFGLSGDGYTFLSDDVVPIDRHTERLVPVPVAACLKQGSWALAGMDDSVPCYERLGASVKYATPRAFRVEPPASYIVVCPVYDSRCDGAELARLSPVDLFVELVESESLLARQVDRELLESVVDWVEKTPAYRIRYGNIKDASESISKLVDRYR